MPTSLRIHSIAKPKPSALSSLIAFHRFSICQDCAAPLEITEMTFSRSRLFLFAKASATARDCASPTMQIWLTILVSWPEPGPAHQDGQPDLHRRAGAVPGRSAGLRKKKQSGSRKSHFGDL